MFFKGYRLPLFSSLIIWAILWEIVGHTELGFILPPLSKIAGRVFEIIPTPSFSKALYITGKTFLIGNVIALGVGIPVGILMGRSKTADAMLSPWVNLFLSAPVVSISSGHHGPRWNRGGHYNFDRGVVCYLDSYAQR